jgi:hypothetical protein
MLSRLESGKDTLQVAIESAAVHAGRIMMIITTAVRDVTREAGEFATDLFEMREASRLARADRERGARSNGHAPDGDGVGRSEAFVR